MSETSASAIFIDHHGVPVLIEPETLNELVRSTNLAT